MQDYNIIKKGVNKILSEWSIETINDIKSILSSKGKIAKGVLLNSFKAMLNEKGIYIEYAKYGEFVDKGRRPGKMPPLKTIQDWCMVKGIPEKMAFPIALKIKREGTKGANFSDTITESIKELTELIAKELAKDTMVILKDNIETEFKNQIES